MSETYWELKLITVHTQDFFYKHHKVDKIAKLEDSYMTAKKIPTAKKLPLVGLDLVIFVLSVQRFISQPFRHWDFQKSKIVMPYWFWWNHLNPKRQMVL